MGGGDGDGDDDGSEELEGGTGVRSTKVRIGPQVGVEEGKNGC